MKKIIIPVIILALLFSACSCYTFGGLNQKEVCEDLVKAFDQNDIDAAKKLFSDKVKKDVDLDKQLKDAFKYYNSKSVSTKYRESTGGSSVDPEGDDNYWECCDMIVRTKDTTFLFSFTIITFNDDSDRMGISELCVYKNYNEKKGSFDDSFAFVGEHIYTDWESEEKDICIYTLSEQSFDPYSDFDDYNGEYIADNTSLEEDDFSFIVKDGKMEIWIEKIKSFEEDEIQELILSGRIENYSGDSFDLVVEKVNPKYEKNRKVGDVITFKPDQ